MYFKGCSLYYQILPYVKTKKIKKPAVIGQIHLSQQGKASTKAKLLRLC